MQLLKCSRKHCIIHLTISFGMFSTALIIADFSSATVAGRFLKTSCLRCPHKKSHGERSGDLAGQLISPLSEIMRPGNIFFNSWRHFPPALAVAPSCWNQTVFPLGNPGSFGLTKLSSISTYRSDVTVTALSSSSKTYESQIPKLATTHQTVTFWLCNSRSSIIWGLLSAQALSFCLLRLTER